MRLLTPEVLALLPPMRAQEDSSDAIAHVKFFTPDAAATWWATEYDPKHRTFFGFVTLGDHEMAELGYFTLDELEALLGPMGLHVERDKSFKPTPLSEIRKSLGN